MDYILGKSLEEINGKLDALLVIANARHDLEIKKAEEEKAKSHAVVGKASGHGLGRRNPLNPKPKPVSIPEDESEEEEDDYSEDESEENEMAKPVKPKKKSLREEVDDFDDFDEKNSE